MTRPINKIIVHCSASNEGDVKLIRMWHKARNFRDVGYHYIIRRDGEIELGRMLSEQGAHCYGHNEDSVGICLIGREDFEQCQFDSLKRLVGELERWFPNIEVYGHRDFTDKKTCPNFDVHELLR